MVSLPTRGAWIEMGLLGWLRVLEVSLPTRGAWIEISDIPANYDSATVAPHAGSVDRNKVIKIHKVLYLTSLPTRGAWIEIWLSGLLSMAMRSLPTRGAWIEIAR